MPNFLHVVPYGLIYKISDVQGTHMALSGALHKAKTRHSYNITMEALLFSNTKLMTATYYSASTSLMSYLFMPPFCL
jgi:hypothetical protein